MKNFVLDTNVILHDASCIYNFEDNDIYLPIVVLEELDKFKKGNEQINFNAREFIRDLDAISDNNLFKEGAPLGEGLGRLYILIGDQYNNEIIKAFPEKIPDHRILSSTKSLMNRLPNKKTILVTKDVNLRMKARSFGIEVEDYYSDKVENPDLFNTIQKDVYVAEAEIIDQMYKNNRSYSFEEIGLSEEPKPNDCFNIISGNSNILARYNPFRKRVVKVEKTENSGIKPRNAEQAFAFELLNDPDVKLLGITGRAGTGKTLLALAAALAQTDYYKQVYLMRPIVSLSNKDLGFLPGSEKEKIAPFMQPLFDNLSVIKFQAEIGRAHV